MSGSKDEYLRILRTYDPQFAREIEAALRNQKSHAVAAAFAASDLMNALASCATDLDMSQITAADFVRSAVKEHPLDQPEATQRLETALWYVVKVTDPEYDGGTTLEELDRHLFEILLRSPERHGEEEHLDQVRILKAAAKWAKRDSFERF